MGWQNAGGWASRGWSQGAAGGGGVSTVVHEGNGAANHTGTGHTSVSSLLFTMPTVSNGLLILFGAFDGGGVTTAPTGISFTWNSVALEQIGSLIAATDNNSFIGMWGLRNPATGNQTLAGSWTNVQDFVFTTAYFSNVNQTGGASTYGTTVSATGTGATQSVSITGATTDFLVAMQGSWGNYLSNTQTLINDFGGTNVTLVAECAAGTGGSTTLSCTTTGTPPWAALAADLKPV